MTSWTTEGPDFVVIWNIKFGVRSGRGLWTYGMRRLRFWRYLMKKYSTNGIWRIPMSHRNSTSDFHHLMCLLNPIAATTTDGFVTV